MAFLLFLSFMNITDLTKLITAGGMTELANHQMFLYALFILSLFLFAACITRRSHRKDYVLQVPRAKRKLAKRTIVAAVLISRQLQNTQAQPQKQKDEKSAYHRKKGGK